MRQVADAKDTFLVGLAQHGERDAFAELVRRNQSWVRNLLRKLSQQTDIVDDLAQQVFLTAFKDIKRLREIEKFHGWLKGITVNTWRMFARAQSTQPPTTSDELAEPLPDAVEDNSNSGLSEDLNTALAQLEEDVRGCIVLAYHEGLSHKEISDTLDLPLGTVKSHIKRGSERLRNYLSSYVSSSDATSQS